MAIEAIAPRIAAWATSFTIVPQSQTSLRSYPDRRGANNRRTRTLQRRDSLLLPRVPGTTAANPRLLRIWQATDVGEQFHLECPPDCGYLGAILSVGAGFYVEREARRCTRSAGESPTRCLPHKLKNALIITLCVLAPYLILHG
jgi:hypothetical protein